jgi:hypothetical protein
MSDHPKQEELFILSVMLNKKDGIVSVRGDLSNKPFCVNLLASAIHAVVNSKPEKKLIEVPGFVPPKDVGRKEG